MVAITEDDVRQLAGYKGENAPVTSCYLDVDGRHRVRQQDVEKALDMLLRRVRDDDQTASVTADLQRIGEYVRSGFDRKGVRGLAIFSCSAHELWRVYPLPVRVRDQLVVNHTPAVRQLEVVVDEYERFGVLLADKQRARMFVFELGQLVECQEEFDQLPRHEDDGGTWSKDHVQGHSAELAHQHLRHAARVAFDVWQQNGFQRLIVGAPDEIASELERELHPYLQERLCARVSVPISASLDDVREAALEVEAQVERSKEDEVVSRLREAVGSGRRGAAGLKDTLEALVERRVETLLVSHGYTAPGWRCPGCSYVASVGPKCPVCETAMAQIDDVVEEAVEEALAQKCRVEICMGNADLDVLGRIGALLRF